MRERRSNAGVQGGGVWESCSREEMEGRHPKEIERLALLLAGADGSREGCGDKEIEREDCLLMLQCPARDID